MNLVLLPGNDHSNRVWVDELEKSFSPYFEKVYTQYYDHWFGGTVDEDLMIDVDLEVDKLTVQLEQFSPYMIFAKSVGVLVALEGIYGGVLRPEVCVFVGTPLEWADAHGFAVDEWLVQYAVPTLFIQNEYDPVASSEFLVGFLQSMDVQRCEILSLDGNAHLYEDIEQLLYATEKFVDLD